MSEETTNPEGGGEPIVEEKKDESAATAASEETTEEKKDDNLTTNPLPTPEGEKQEGEASAQPTTTTEEEVEKDVSSDDSPPSTNNEDEKPTSSGGSADPESAATTRTEDTNSDNLNKSTKEDTPSSESATTAVPEKEGEDKDTPAAETTTGTTTIEADAEAEAEQAAEEEEEASPPLLLKHSFQPGDHVIRWEMLPIVWPIQVHGIVLEVNEYCVTICDFGLTAEMRQEDGEDSSQKEVEENLDENSKKKHPRLQEAWDRVKPPDNRKKERITVHIITTQEEIKPWKKVHYGRGLFGMGKDGEEGEEGADGSEEGGVAPNATPKKGAVIKQKVGTWFKRGLQNIQHRREVRQAARQQREKEAAAAAAATNTAAADKTEGTDGDFSIKSAPFDDDTSNNNEEEQMQPQPPLSPTKTVDPHSNNSSPTKNPSFLKGDFAAYHQDQNNNTMTKTSSDPSLNGGGKDNNKEQQKNEKNKLPESDPPKLVLARTRLLLQQGENILPPYHPFKSNSECIAVFCKTGYWRTLQASVFLHSTAIGNAKSSMAMTLGVAASVPLLAPAVALAGAAMVGAPYIILNQSHKTWQETTLRLNEEFWKQAPNEVFVECIEHWSGLTTPKNNNDNSSEAADNSDNKDEEDPTAQKEQHEEKKPASQRFVSV